MPPVQKTFDLIPNILGSGLGRPGLAHDAAAHGPPAKPPMTSKQAKKLYKQANKAPKLSKAEQRRIELMEQDRIRKELEKEKAQARARVARDRKKAKEEAQREAKKRKGLPLVDVRPSQDTIARFVRGNGTSKKRDSTGVELQPQSCLRTVEEGEEANDPPDKENEEPRPSPESRQPSNSLGPIAVPAVSEQSLDMMKSQNGASTVLEDAMSVQLEDVSLCGPKTLPHLDPPNRRRSRSSGAHTDEGETEQAIHNQHKASSPDVMRPSSRKLHNSHSGTISPARDISTVQVKHAVSNGANSRSQVPSQMSRDSVAVVQGTPPLQHAIAPKAMSSSMNTPCVIGSRPIPRSRVKHVGTGMGPPPVPPRFKSPLSKPTNAVQQPKFLPKTPRTPLIVQPGHVSGHQRAVVSEDLPPTSTQFVLSHLDDLFPTPSQEARELLEDTQPCTLPKPTLLTPLGPAAMNPRPIQSKQVPALSNTDGKVTLAQATMDGDSGPDLPFFSSQDFFLSSQDVRELESCITTISKRQETTTRTHAIIGPGCRTSQLIERPAPSNTAPPKLANLSWETDGRVVSKHSGLPVKYHSSCWNCAPIQRHIHFQPLASITQNDSRSPGLNGLVCQGAAQNPDGLNMTTRCSAVHQRPFSPGKGLSDPIVTCSSRSNDMGDTTHGEIKVPRNLKCPPKKRVFSSSGIGADGLCAMERSHRLLRQEQQQTCSGVRALGGQLKEQKFYKPDTIEALAAHAPNVSQEDFLSDELDCVPSQLLRIVEGGPHIALTGLENRSVSTRPSSGISLQGCRAILPSDPRGVLSGSQETDYGDFEIGLDELDQLGVLGIVG